MRRCLIKITRVMTILMILDWPFDSSPHDLMIVSLIETNMWYLYHIKLSITVSLLWVVLLLTTQLFEFSLVPWRFSWRAEQCHIRSWYDDNDGDYVMILMEEMMIRMMMMIDLKIFFCHVFYISVYLSDVSSAHLSIYLSICLSIHLLICPSIYLFIYLSIYLSIHKSFWGTVISSMLPLLYFMNVCRNMSN